MWIFIFNVMEPSCTADTFVRSRPSTLGFLFNPLCCLPKEKVKWKQAGLEVVKRLVWLFPNVAIE